MSHGDGEAKQLCKLLSKTGAALDFCYEAGSCGYGVHRTISGLGHGCSVVAPALYVEPGDPDFMEHYHAARRGILTKRPTTARLVKPKQIRGSLNWLMTECLCWLEKQVAAGQYSPATLKQRRSKFRRLKSVGEYSLEIPQPELLKLRDSMISTPGATDNFINSVRAMYAWVVKRNICELNPATGIGKLQHVDIGAKAWTLEDLNRYRAKHPPEPMAHLALTLFMFTACRISDIIHPGRDNEFERKPAVEYLTFPV